MPPDYFVYWKLKRIRQEANLTHRQVADHLGWSVPRYRYYEAEYLKPCLDDRMIEHLLPLFTERGIDAVRVLDLGSARAIAAGYIDVSGDRIRYTPPKGADFWK